MIKYIFVILLSVACFSCKKSWLELVPQGNTVATRFEDYDKIMNNPLLYNYQYGGGWEEPILLGDEIAAETPRFAGNAIKDKLFQWQDDVYLVTDALPWLLNYQLSQRYTYNKVINEVMNVPDGTDAQKRAVRAQAMAARAWSHFQLVSYYCKPYVAGTAGTDPGFPIVTEADITIPSYTRGTLQQSYDYIIRNFTDAIPDLAPLPSSPTRMSRPAAKGLLGKVYLFMGRYSDALPLLKEALSEATAPGGASLYNYNQAFGADGAFLPINATTGPKSPFQNFTDVKESVLFKVFVSQYNNTGLVIAPQAALLYDPADLRLNFYTNRNPDGSLNAGGRLRKYGVANSRFGLQLPELYLLAAECKARMNELDGAVADVKTLRENRMPAGNAPVPPAIAGNQKALIQFILDERIREFAMEGYRWFDMRRLSVDPLFTGLTFTHSSYNADGTTTVYTLKQPNRLVLRIPARVMEVNPDLGDNP
jgi:tetratricopeptide (TPR) repeat protein